ncbi:hypothetical protein AB0H58_31180 [Nocardia neocaledoniensis]|uniref:hypothetical protein n=1 Tax=Nocardia neocaledoniensis TaxID=236511 RepID=UPI0033D4BAE0
MSFLLRRNLPRAWAGFRDTFDRPPQNPLLPPWKHLGGGESFINSLEELVCTQQIVNEDGRGPSYTYMPFTDCWGFETEVWYPVEGVDNQIFCMGFTNTWVDVEATFQNVFGVWLYHDLGGADLVQTGEVPTMWSPIQNRRSWPSPVGAFFGKTLTVRVWVEADEWARVWLNGIYVGSSLISPSYRLGPGRRCMRFMNRSYCNAYVRWVHHYDRTPSVPTDEVWSSVFFDNFNRGNGAVGNGWSSIGSRGSITANSWGRTPGDGTDASVAIQRDTAHTTGRIRIEATAGGNFPVRTDRSSGLILCGNTAGTAGLIANVYGDHVYIQRYTSSLSNNLPSYVTLNDGPVDVFSGDKIAFCLYDGVAWVEKNGERVAYAGDVHSDVPATNTWAGLRAERKDFNESHSWNDVRVLTAA